MPLERLATVATTWGPGMISSEDSRLVAHVMFSPSGGAGDLETVDAVMKSLTAARASGELTFPEGNFELQPVGSFQNQIEANQRLMWLIPMVLLINFLLHYLHFRNVPIALVVFTGIPVSFAGGMIAVALMGVEMNTAIWVGFIALFGLAADDGIVIASYIKHVLERRRISTVERTSRGDLRSGFEANSTLHDDDDHHPGRPGSRAAGHRTRSGCRPGDGPARIRRHADRTVFLIYRAHSVLRLHGIQIAGRPARRVAGNGARRCGVRKRRFGGEGRLVMST